MPHLSCSSKKLGFLSIASIKIFGLNIPKIFNEEENQIITIV
jgi:hypothetical protein